MRDFCDIKRETTKIGELRCPICQTPTDPERVCRNCYVQSDVLLLGIPITAERYAWGIFVGGAPFRFLCLLRCAACGRLVETPDRSCWHAAATGQLCCSVTLLPVSDILEIHLQTAAAAYPPVDGILIRLDKNSDLAPVLREHFAKVSDAPRSALSKTTYYRQTQVARDAEKDERKVQAQQWDKQGIKREIIAQRLNINTRTLRRWLNER